MDVPERHLRLLTETIAAVNSTLDLQEVLELVATNVAEALDTDACFVYLYDERAGRARPARDARDVGRGDDAPAEDAAGRGDHGRRRRGAAAGDDPRAGAPRSALQGFPNLPEEEYESILAVPILAREKLEGALNVRTREPREFSAAEIELLLAIAAQVAQSIEHAKLYAQAQRRVEELEALARISEAVSESLYLEESLEAIVKTTMDAVSATGAALVLEDGKIAWPEGRAGEHAVRTPLRWKRRQIGELVADRDTPFTDEERQLLASIAHHAAVALGARARGDARRARPGDPPPGEEQPPDRRVAAAAPGARRRRSMRGGRSTTRSTGSSRSPPSTRCSPSAATRASTSASCSSGCGRCSCRGSARARRSRRRSSRSRSAGDRATALALVFSELLQNALEHGGDAVRIELAQRNGDVVARDRRRRRRDRRRAAGDGALDRRGARARRARRDAVARGRRRAARRGRVPGVIS